ncbi:MAG: hypothetical protein AAB970_00045 [Patescibacteria group bacterium]
MPSDKFPKNSIEKPKKVGPELEAFQKEIADLKEKAKKEKITGSTELPGINSDYLTKKDAEMWNRCESNSIALADVGLESEYNKNIKLEKNKSIYNSRHSFIAFLRQRLTFPQLKNQYIDAIDIISFRKGIGYIIDRINNGEIKGTMQDLTYIENLDNITKEDAYMWHKIKKLKSISEEDEEELNTYIKKTEDSKNLSRINFARVINQKYSSLILQEQTEQRKNSEKKKPTKSQYF